MDGNFVDALYVSGVALTTVGFGNVVPQDGLLRLALVIEGVIGFALLTASISWVLAIYPGLQRSRALAGRTLTLLEGGDDPRLIAGDDSSVLAVVLYDMSNQIGTTRIDLIQYPATFFFHAPAEELSLARALERLDGALGRDDIPEDATTAAAAARSSLRKLGDSLKNGPFGLKAAGASDALRAYRASHTG